MGLTLNPALPGLSHEEYIVIFKKKFFFKKPILSQYAKLYTWHAN